jgi:hypothetical protein
LPGKPQLRNRTEDSLYSGANADLGLPTELITIGEHRVVRMTIPSTCFRIGVTSGKPGFTAHGSPQLPDVELLYTPSTAA